MKKFLIVFLCMFFVCPLGLKAETFTLNESEINIDVDASKWYVFTRDNLKDNPNIDKLGLTYDYLNGFMTANSAYLDAILMNKQNPEESVEFFVRIKKAEGIKNLSSYPDDEVKDVAKGLAEKQGCENYKVYKKKYSYARLEYQQSSYSIVEFYTVINGNGYTFTAQKDGKYNQNEIEEIEKIINSVDFKIDDKLKEDVDNIPRGKLISNWIIKLGIVGAILGGSIGMAFVLIDKKNKK